MGLGGMTQNGVQQFPGDLGVCAERRKRLKLWHLFAVALIFY